MWPEPYLGSLLPDSDLERTTAREGLALLGRRNLISGLGSVLAMARGAVPQGDSPPSTTNETERPDNEPSSPDRSDAGYRFTARIRYGGSKHGLGRTCE